MKKIKASVIISLALFLFTVCGCDKPMPKYEPEPEPIDKNVFSMRLDEGIVDDIYITNEKGIDVHNVHGVLLLTGSKDDHAKATFYRNTWNVGDCFCVSLAGNETVHDIQKITMRIKTDEGFWAATWTFKN